MGSGHWRRGLNGRRPGEAGWLGGSVILASLGVFVIALLVEIVFCRRLMAERDWRDETIHLMHQLLKPGGCQVAIDVQGDARASMTQSARDREHVAASLG